jgi:hypothetical protein
VSVHIGASLALADDELDDGELDDEVVELSLAAAFVDEPPEQAVATAPRPMTPAQASMSRRESGESVDRIYQSCTPNLGAA